MANEDDKNELSEKIKADIVLAETYLFGLGKERNVAEAKRCLEKVVEQTNDEELEHKFKLVNDGLFDDDYPDISFLLNDFANIKENKKSLKSIFKLAEERLKISNYNAKKLNDEEMLPKNFYDGLVSIEDLQTKDRLQDYDSNRLASYGYLLLGVCYYFGDVFEQDFGKSFNLFKYASLRGNYDAMCLLGNSYRLGLGVKRDVEKAFYWFSVALDFGFSWSAVEGLGIMYLVGDYMQKDEKLAFLFFQGVMRVGFATGTYFVAVCKYYGFGTEKNIDEAKELLELAKSQGCYEAEIFDRMKDWQLNSFSFLILKKIGVGLEKFQKISFVSTLEELEMLAKNKSDYASQFLFALTKVGKDYSWLKLMLNYALEGNFLAVSFLEFVGVDFEGSKKREIMEYYSRDDVIMLLNILMRVKLENFLRPRICNKVGLKEGGVIEVGSEPKQILEGLECFAEIKSCVEELENNNLI